MTRLRFLQSRPVSAATIAMMLGLSAASAGSETSPQPNVTTSDHSSAIKSILPHDRVGDEICFEGTFSGQTVDMEDWLHTSKEVVPGLDVGGKPAIRTKPSTLPDQEVSRVALHLTYDNRTRDGAFDFRFTLMAASKSLSKKLFARSGCAWSEKENRLGCWIECDGGGLSVERIAGTESLNVSFSNLFMQAGCEGGGAYRVGTGDEADKINFRLERVPLRVCKPLKAWARKQ